ncbi:MAG: Uma2 family endonuclease [Saprospirales bacterium]|nr:Uma2 family endonuclease [Saprospirales bacterium]
MTPVKVNLRHDSLVNDGSDFVNLRHQAPVSIQNPINLDEFSEPEPDVAVLKPRPDDYTESHATPEEILFLIEVSDTSLAKDRTIKLPLYAKAGIPETWIVDLEKEQVEVYREPGPQGYAQVQVFEKGKAVKGVFNVEFLVFS